MLVLAELSAICCNKFEYMERFCGQRVCADNLCNAAFLGGADDDNFIFY